MAITKIASEQYGVATFLFDDIEEFTNLPVKDGVGSTAFCPDTGDIYILNGSKEWVKFGGESE